MKLFTPTPYLSKYLKETGEHWVITFVHCHWRFHSHILWATTGDGGTSVGFLIAFQTWRRGFFCSEEQNIFERLTRHPSAHFAAHYPNLKLFEKETISSSAWDQLSFEPSNTTVSMVQTTLSTLSIGGPHEQNKFHVVFPRWIYAFWSKIVHMCLVAQMKAFNKLMKKWTTVSLTIHFPKPFLIWVMCQSLCAWDWTTCKNCNFYYFHNASWFVIR